MPPTAEERLKLFENFTYSCDVKVNHHADVRGLLTCLDNLAGRWDAHTDDKAFHRSVA